MMATKESCRHGVELTQVRLCVPQAAEQEREDCSNFWEPRGFYHKPKIPGMTLRVKGVSLALA